MNFRDDEKQAEWRNEVRQFLEREEDAIPTELEGESTWRSDPKRMEWRRRLRKQGWIAPAWPKEYGGLSLGVMDQFILNEEFAEAGVAQGFDTGVMLVGPTLITHGSEQQRAEHLPKILEGEIVWCQGFSEPGAGSDLASLQTKAVRDGDEWVINGQKIWTSYSHEADWIFMLARTDAEAPKHRGISMFLIDMQTPGISVSPLLNINGEHGFNETFFDDVRVPAENVVGEVNRGWYIGTTTLDFERSAVGNSVGQRKTIEKYLQYFREHRGTGAVVDSESIRLEFAERWIEAATAKLHSQRVATLQANGEIPNHEASIAKLFTSELGQRIGETALRALGAYGGLMGPAAPFEGRVTTSYIRSVSSTIAGGTSEIQRNIIATRGLGLPRG